MVCNKKVNVAEFLQKIEIFDRKLVSKHTGRDICAGSVTLSRWKQNSEGKTKFIHSFREFWNLRDVGFQHPTACSYMCHGLNNCRFVFGSVVVEMVL